ncbi:MAG: class A beta-lactamase [Pseudolabrys sp.]|nr:class A beta-lactamase [Pseudolabrys sp.]
MPLTRRNLMLGSVILPFSNARAATPPEAGALRAAEARLATLEKADGGRLGVAVLDTGTGARLSHRANERFAMASTFKFLAAAAVLNRVDAGKARLDQAIRYGQSDLLSYAPETKKHVTEGQMSLGDLCAAAVAWSDNTAANLMLRQVGGPQGLTRYLRTLGDDFTRLDRIEPALNSAIPGDPRDTTTPNAMAGDMKLLLVGDALSAASRQRLAAWMIASKTGAKRLRAGLPPSWQVGDKTGGGGHATANTIAMIWPPGRAPLVAAVYYTESRAAPPARDAVHAEVARIVAATF